LTDIGSQRHIRLRLHGTRLPLNYTISLRLSTTNDRSNQPHKPKRRRRYKTTTQKATTAGAKGGTATDSEPERRAPDEPSALLNSETEEVIPSDLNTDEDEDEQIRKNNAYPGATNSIDSIHQRQWFLSLDRKSSGFVKISSSSKAGQTSQQWERVHLSDGSLSGFEPFFVRGRDVERSVLTGRLAIEVMQDEGVEGFKGRKMWRTIDY